MKQLFWKEWYELRLLPLGAVLMFALLSLGYLMACMLQLAWQRPQDFTEDGFVLILVLVWVLFAVIAGSGLISQEIGTGTLSFLLALPRSRRRIWVVKSLVGFGTLVLCALCSTFACSLFWAFSVQWARPETDLAPWLGSSLAHAFLAATGCYAVSLVVSSLLDRYISAAMVSVVACILIAYIIVAACSGPFRNQYLPDLSASLEYMCVWLAIPAMMAISYWTFTHGESLRSAKRFYVAGAAAIVAFVVFLMLFLSIRAYTVALFVHPQTASSAGRPAVLQTSYDRWPWYDMSTLETFRLAPHAGLLYAVGKLQVDGQDRCEITIPS